MILSICFAIAKKVQTLRLMNIAVINEGAEKPLVMISHGRFKFNIRKRFFTKKLVEY